MLQHRMCVLITALIAASAGSLPSAAQTKKVAIGYASASDFLPAFIGKEKGCFERRDLDVTLILSFFPRVFDENNRLPGCELDAIKLAIRAAFLDRSDLDCRFLVTREPNAGLLEKCLGKDHSRIGFGNQDARRKAKLEILPGFLAS